RRDPSFARVELCFDNEIGGALLAHWPRQEPLEPRPAHQGEPRIAHAAPAIQKAEEAADRRQRPRDPAICEPVIAPAALGEIGARTARLKRCKLASRHLRIKMRRKNPEKRRDVALIRLYRMRAEPPLVADMADKVLQKRCCVHDLFMRAQC